MVLLTHPLQGSSSVLAAVQVGPRHCLNVQTVCFAQEGALNKFLVDGRVCCSCWSSGFHRWSVQMFTRAVLASVDILQFFGRLIRREGVTAASAAVQKDGVHGPG